MKTVQISIVHYAENKDLHFNDVLADQVRSIKALTKHPYSLNIIDNQMHAEARKDLEKKLPDVEIIRTEGIHHTYPAGANTAIEHLTKDYMFLSHTDMLMSHNWLTSLAQDLETIENTYKVPASTCPLLIPYPRLDTTPDAKTMLKSIRTRSGLNNNDITQKYMDTHGLPHAPWEGRELAVCRPGSLTDNGWRLGGAYMASKILQRSRTIRPHDQPRQR